MTTVYWTPYVDFFDGVAAVPETDIIFSEPQSFLKKIVKERESAEYPKCPAFIEYAKNIYVIAAPFDMVLQLNKETGYMQTNLTQEMFDVLCVNRLQQKGQNDPFCVTMPPNYLFYSNESVMMESMPAFLHNNETLNDIRVIPATFDISKWIRTVDFTFEVVDCTKTITFKAGDPLFYVRFISKNNDRIQLERVIADDKIKRAVQTCTLTKRQIQKLSLNTLYEKADPFLKALGFKQTKRCPFNFWRKK